VNQHEVIEQVAALGGVDVLEAGGDYYLFYDPRNGEPVEQLHPFATLVTADRHDPASNLDREGVYRLNFGVSKKTYESILGPRPSWPKDGAMVVETGYDYTSLDKLMPHPVYSPQSWMCVLNPSEETFESLRPLLTEAYERAAESHRKRSG
jgi:hypothetical protein